MSFPYYTEPTHVVGTTTTGLRSTQTTKDEGRLKLDVADQIFFLDANLHPFVTILTSVGKSLDGGTWKGSGMLKATTGNPEFKWIEKFPGGRYAKNVGTYSASGGVTITVTGAGSQPAYIFTVGDTIVNARTGERMKVATIASANTITVVAGGRSLGSTASAAGADGDGLFIIGNASEEGSGARNLNSTKAVPQTNFCQIFKTSMAATGTNLASENYGGNDLTVERRVKGVEHGLDIERAFLFGEKGETTGTNGFPERYTGGVLEFVEGGNSYVQDQDGPVTASDLDVFLREGFTYGSSTKILMAGGLVVSAINEIARGQIQTKVGQSNYGVKIAEWMTSFGTIKIVHHPLFVQDYAGYAFLLDLDCFRYRFMKGRDTHIQFNVQAPDADAQIDQYFSEVGLERKLAAKCALLKGVTN